MNSSKHKRRENKKKIMGPSGSWAFITLRSYFQQDTK
jgi:hypothetical protein